MQVNCKFKLRTLGLKTFFLCLFVCLFSLLTKLRSRQDQTHRSRRQIDLRVLMNSGQKYKTMYLLMCVTSNATCKRMRSFWRYILVGIPRALTKSPLLSLPLKKMQTRKQSNAFFNCSFIHSFIHSTNTYNLQCARYGATYCRSTGEKTYKLPAVMKLTVTLFGPWFANS